MTIIVLLYSDLYCDFYSHLYSNLYNEFLKQFYSDLPGYWILVLNFK